jgi:hypothetical protein
MNTRHNMTITVAMMMYLFLGYIVLSSISNAMDMKDRSFYGFLFRFLRNLTNSAAPLVAQELHITPSQLQGLTQGLTQGQGAPASTEPVVTVPTSADPASIATLVAKYLAEAQIAPASAQAPIQ